MAVSEIIDLGGSIVNGFLSSEPCKVEEKARLSDEIATYLEPQDMIDLVRGTERNVAPDPDAMAEFYYGGRDCKHKNVTSGDQKFLDSLRPLIGKRKREFNSRTSSPTLQTFADPGAVSSGSGSLIAGMTGTAWAVIAGVVAVAGTLIFAFSR